MVEAVAVGADGGGSLGGARVSVEAGGFGAGIGEETATSAGMMLMRKQGGG